MPLTRVRSWVAIPTISAAWDGDATVARLAGSPVLSGLYDASLRALLVDRLGVRPSLDGRDALAALATLARQVPQSSAEAGAQLTQVRRCYGMLERDAQEASSAAQQRLQACLDTLPIPACRGRLLCALSTAGVCVVLGPASASAAAPFLDELQTTPPDFFAPSATTAAAAAGGAISGLVSAYPRVSALLHAVGRLVDFEALGRSSSWDIEIGHRRLAR